MLPNNDIPEEVKEQVFEEARQVYERRMNEERAKTAAQREAEALTAQIAKQAEQIQNAATHAFTNRGELKRLEGEMSAAQARLDELTGKQSMPSRLRRARLIGGHGIVE